jgi:hypothetical protein
LVRAAGIEAIMGPRHLNCKEEVGGRVAAFTIRAGAYPTPALCNNRPFSLTLFPLASSWRLWELLWRFVQNVCFARKGGAMRRLTGLLMAGVALLFLTLSAPADDETGKKKAKPDTANGKADKPDTGNGKAKDKPDTGKNTDTPDSGKTKPRTPPDAGKGKTTGDIDDEPLPGPGRDTGKGKPPGDPTQGKPKDDTGKPAAGPPPNRVYTHTTRSGRKCKFELQGERGKGEYYWNGQKQNEDLKFTRGAMMNGRMAGWVYKTGKQNMWFFFASSPAQGSKDYPVYYTQTPPGQDGKQPWTLCPTQGGTSTTESKGGGAERSEDGEGLPR